MRTFLFFRHGILQINWIQKHSDYRSVFLVEKLYILCSLDYITKLILVQLSIHGISNKCTINKKIILVMICSLQ